jgi:carboxyl-terminal processing protease
MQDKVQLASILKGEGSFKIIGKPVLAMAAKNDEDKDDSED